ncbi:MAG: aspartate kinase [Planctomycetota bacterium]
MGIVVQKFGGTSVASVEKMRRCAQHVLRERASGHDVIVTVSAMGKTTDQFVALAAEASDNPSRREMDMLLSSGERISIALMAMVLESMGQPAISFTARQIGMTTDSSFTRARIESIDADVLKNELARGKVAIVAGFQGVTKEGDVTTLGRGGSDTTAVAVAAAVGADVCEIYTDVDGVYTTDPRKVPSARRLERVGTEEMLELASMGAGVLHPRAVLFAAKFGVPIHVRHSQRDDAGTIIAPGDQNKQGGQMERIEVTGIALKDGLGRVTLEGIPDTPGVAARVFASLAERTIVVDDIIQTVTVEDGKKKATVSFTVDHGELSDMRPVLDALLQDIGGGTSTIDVGFSKVSVVGAGIGSHAEVASTMFRALADAGINIANISTSEIKVGVLIDKTDGERALSLLHEAFGLGASPT